MRPGSTAPALPGPFSRADGWTQRHLCPTLSRWRLIIPDTNSTRTEGAGRDECADRASGSRRGVDVSSALRHRNWSIFAVEKSLSFSDSPTKADRTVPAIFSLVNPQTRKDVAVGAHPYFYIVKHK